MEGVLLDILVVLIAAKVAAELAERMRLPAVVGEILAGILIGPSVLGLVGGEDVLRVLGEIGVILLLLEVGMEMDLADMRAVGRASMSVATVGVIVPFVLGFGVVEAFGHDSNTAIFLGAALTATSVGITARVFSDLRALTSVESRTVLGAAVADDVMGLVILTVVVRIVSGGAVSPATVVGVVALAVGFLVITGLLGIRLAPALFRVVNRLSRSRGTLVAIALAFTLGFAELASVAKLAPIVGAFVAGLSLTGSDQADRIRRELTPVGHLFIPVFFLQIGIDADIAQFTKPAVLGLAAALLAVAALGKLVAGIAAASGSDRLLVGIGMLPRGEVGLIFATIGLREGVLGQDLYGALLLVVLATTLITPPVLKWRLLRVRAARRAQAGPVGPVPEGGWLRVTDGVVELAGEPPPTAALPLGLRAAALSASCRPGPRLLEWLGNLGEGPLRWDEASRRELLALLSGGNVRSWRFLEMTGLLDRALPELAEALQRRRDDPFELDPTSALRWGLVERVRELTRDPGAAVELGRLQHPEWLTLAALLLDANEGAPRNEVVPAARRLVQRLDQGAAAEQEIALLVGDNDLLLAAARRPDGTSEESVLQLAAHLDRPERARALFLLTLALAEDDPWERQRIDDLYGLVQAALANPALTGLEARNLVERHRAEAVRIAGPQSPAAERIAVAPRAYLLTQESADVARQAALLEPLPSRDRARAAVTAVDAPGVWRVDVAARDRPGLLATITGVLFDAGLDVVDAVVATWPDGGALDAFRVKAAIEPDADALARAAESCFGAPMGSSPVSDAAVTFDDAASPWYTICEVEAPDRPGLLHALAVALAAGGADVHSARLTSEGGIAHDRFELTDRAGGKLSAVDQERVVNAISGGVVPRRRRWRTRNKAATRRTHSGDRAETVVP